MSSKDEEEPVDEVVEIEEGEEPPSGVWFVEKKSVEEAAEAPVEELAEEPIEEAVKEPLEERGEAPAEEVVEVKEGEEPPSGVWFVEKKSVEEAAEAPVEEEAMEAPTDEIDEKPIVEIIEEPSEEEEELLQEEPLEEPLEEPEEEIAVAPTEEITFGPVKIPEPVTPTGFSFVGFCFGYFYWLGKPILRLYRGIEEDLRIANINIHAEAYTSLIGFIVVITTILSFAGVPLLIFKMYGPALGNIPQLGFLQDIPYPFFVMFILPPVLTLFFGYVFPKIKASNRSAALEVEVPYAAAYVSVMSTGGLSPYRSLSRLKYMDLLPNLSKAAKKMDLEIQILGHDPITAIETLATSTPSREYRDLLMGYSSTLSAGGDVLHYLGSKTETLFRDRLAKIKAIGERMALLLEIYIALAVLLALGVYMMFIVARIMPAGAQMPTAFGSGQFFMFGYILFPIMSVFFLYFADMSQPSYPTGEWRPYYVFAASLPLMAYLFMGMFVAFFVPESIFRTHPAFSFLGDFIIIVRDFLGLEKGFEVGIGIALAFIISTLPAAIADYVTGRGAKEIESGITSFIRDLVEVRKTGMSPERSVMTLAKGRDYGRLSPILKDMAYRLGWGMTFRRVYEVFRDKTNSWLARINVFLLYEATEVGGGSPETLESLAHFSETMQSIEKEKAMTLAPLLIVPYIGGVILIASTLLLLSFTRSMLSISGAGIAYVPILTLFTPPLMIHAFLSGLVAGKISAGRISAGFKHAIFLLILSLIAMYVSPMLSLSLQIT